MNEFNPSAHRSRTFLMSAERSTEYCSKKLDRFFTPFERLNNARRLRGLSRGEAAVLHSLNAHADKNGAGYLKAKTIAAETGYERNAIGRSYKGLNERGYVRRVQLKTATGKAGVYSYAVLIPLRLAERGVQYLEAEPRDERQQHNNPIQQHNINTDELFAFEAALMDKLAQHIDFETTPKLISVMPVSRVVFGNQPSNWPNAKNVALEAASELADGLETTKMSLTSWSMLVDLFMRDSNETLDLKRADRKSAENGLEKTDPIAEYLLRHLSAGQARDRSLLAALKDICCQVTLDEVWVTSESRRTLDMIERECSRSLRKLGRSELKRIILMNGETRRTVFLP